MKGFALTEHAADMMRQRGIPVKWIEQAIKAPDKTEVREREGTKHYIRAIKERGGRYLRVVVSKETDPARIITMFFDRRLGRMP